MRILVTGGTGFLGSEVVPRLLDRGHDLFLLTRRWRPCPSHRFHYVSGDVSEGLPDVPVDAVLHMAALTSLWEKDYEKMVRVNVGGTLKAIELCLRKDIPLFHVSTLYVSGTFSGSAGCGPPFSVLAPSSAGTSTGTRRCSGPSTGPSAPSWRATVSS